MITTVYPDRRFDKYHIVSDSFDELKKIRDNLFVFHGYSLDDPLTVDGRSFMDIPKDCLKHILSNYAKMTAAQYMENSGIK